MNSSVINDICVFQRNILPFSGSKSKPSKKQREAGNKQNRRQKAEILSIALLASCFVLVFAWLLLHPEDGCSMLH
jgi:hypothetical protein